MCFGTFHISFLPVRKRQSRTSATIAANAPTTRTMVTSVLIIDALMSPAVYSGTYAMFSVSESNHWAVQNLLLSSVLMGLVVFILAYAVYVSVSYLKTN